jgi:MFS transporter, ACS family, tartrate transporter
VANVIGSPLAGVILGVQWGGLPGWRWLFVLEGIPAVVFGVVTLYLLPDRPKDAKWLATEERDWLSKELAREKDAKPEASRISIGDALRMPRVMVLTLVYFLAVTGIYGFAVWFPTILKRATGFSNLEVTLLAALPYLAGAVAMICNGWHSDRSQERRWHTALPLFVGAACLCGAIYSSGHLTAAFALMVVVGACTTAYLPSFWPLPTEFLSESAAAASIGLINALGNLGGFLGPSAVGLLRSRTGSFTPGLLALSVCMAGAGVLVLSLPRNASISAREQNQ